MQKNGTMLTICLLCSCLLLIWPSLGVSQTLRLAQHDNYTQIPKLLFPLYQVWFAEAGLQVEFVPCSPARCMRMTESGELDGDVGRASQLDWSQTNLQVVAPSVVRYQFYAITQDLALIGDLAKMKAQGHQFICMRGVQWCLKNISSMQLIWCNSEVQCRNMLLRKRGDLMIWLDLPDQHFPAHLDGKPLRVIPLTIVDTHLLLLKRHSAEKQRLEKAWLRLQFQPEWQQSQQATALELGKIFNRRRNDLFSEPTSHE